MDGRFKTGNKMGAPFGNKNASKAALWKRQLDVELKRYEDIARGIKKGTALAHIARMCVEDALSTDATIREKGRNEIANRLDGKPKETVDATFRNALESELTDDELLAIIRGESAGSGGDTETAPGEGDPTGVH